MKIYLKPNMEATEIELHPLMEPSITNTGGNAGVGKADPADPVPPVAQGRRKDIWTDPDEEEEEDFR